MTDQELADRIARGDPDAVTTLVRTHHSSLYRFLYQLTGSAEDAEDLAIQALTRARGAAGRYDGRAALTTWLHRIAFHEFTRWRRKRRWHLSLTSAPPVEETRFRDVVNAQWLCEGLRRLPDGMRAAFLLYEVQQLSVPEVAAVLRVPQGTVKSRLYHARERLRAHLGDENIEVTTRHEVFEA